MKNLIFLFYSAATFLSLLISLPVQTYTVTTAADATGYVVTSTQTAIRASRLHTDGTGSDRQRMRAKYRNKFCNSIMCFHNFFFNGFLCSRR
jgi:hypothetical protein